MATISSGGDYCVGEIQLLLGTFAVTMGSLIINIMTSMVPGSASAHINYFAAL